MIVQVADNGVFAHAIQKHRKYLPNHSGRLLVDHQRVFIVGILDISIGGKRPDMFSVAALHIKDFPHFIRSFRTVVFIQDALDGDRDTPHILGVLIAVQRLVKKGNKADIIPGKPVVQIIALVAVIAE